MKTKIISTIEVSANTRSVNTYWTAKWPSRSLSNYF